MRGLFRFLPIAFENIWSCNFQHAGFAAGYFGAIVIDDSGRHTSQCKANRAWNALAIIGIGRDYTSFGHTIAFENPVARFSLKFREGAFQQRCRTADEKPHGCAAIWREARMIGEADVKSRHAHQHGRMPQVSQNDIDIERSMETHG